MWVVTPRYYYKRRRDAESLRAAPRGVTYLEGCFIDTCTDEKSAPGSGYFGIDIVTSDGGERDHRVLYAKTVQEQGAWVAALRRGARVVEFRDKYALVPGTAGLLGRGRFSSVHLCTLRAEKPRRGASSPKRARDKKKFAVKVIDKKDIKPAEKAMLQTEIAILKLVRHPHIIRMEDVFESRNHIYIVMELITGGELFNRINKRPRLSEESARKIVKALVEAIQYVR